MNKHHLLKSLCASPLLFGLVLTSIADNANAIVIRHDKADAEYLQLAETLAPFVAHLDSCVATVINDHWLITAAHCVNEAEHYPVKITHLQNDYPVSRIIRHPDFAKTGDSDIALLQLDWPLTSAQHAALYTRDDELNQTITIVGKGATGNGITGDAMRDHKLRAATNTVAVVDGNWLSFEFNQADAATALEGVSGTGDSGGPAFIYQANVPYLAGVSCCQEAEEQGTYGAMEHYSRVSTHLTWLQEQQSAHPIEAQVESDILSLLQAGSRADALSLISSRTDWHASDKITQAILIYAFIEQDLALLKTMVATSPKLLEAQIQGLPLLDYALKQGNGRFFKYLVGAGVDLNHRGFRGQHYLSRLMWQYFNDDAVELAQTLIDAGAEVNLQDERGDSALHMAGYQGDLERVKFLVAQGADLNLQDNQGNTLLMDAQRRGQQDIIEYVLSIGAKAE
ncbi:ankyrin repeat domain-containing protein [Alteromonas facilis]|uniref:ankyrin repeat domain-containing protein n=1 Tax=Alteromonas facilis TaxID=2048004 RepID=UPI000C293317|nr:ankyrin repeat domain-containing protein [Alteromonas facilis]